MSEAMSTPEELRDAFDAVSKENKKLQSQQAELLKENRALKAQLATRDAGVKPEVADLYIAANPDADISVDSIKEFVEKYGIAGGEPVPVGEESAEQPSAPSTEGLDQFARAGSRTSPGGSAPDGKKVLTRDEFLMLQKDNPMAARQALAEGRVQLRNDNPLAEGRSPSVNPFLAHRQAAEE